MIERQHWIPYCGAAPLPADWLARWNLDPVLLLALALVAFAYARYAPAGAQRGRFWAAWAVTVLLFVSPLCALSSALFSVRVLHHALLVAVIAPLLAGSLPREPLPNRGTLAGWTAAHLTTIWLWHAPPAYDWALSQAGIFWAMQLSLLVSATSFWAQVRRAPAPAAAAMLLVAMLGMGLLGALITFAGTALYTPHLASTLAWGLTPLEDQQLAGIVMWIPAAIPYLAAALVLLGRMVSGDGRGAPVST